MAIITFYTDGKDQTGNTTSAMALATYLGIVHNKKTLLISTSFNDNQLKEALWQNQNKKKSGLFGPNNSSVNDNGIEGLDRIMRSNKISPDIITDYAKVALKNRLEILFGYHGDKKQYEEIQTRYTQLLMLASQSYNNVVVDLDNELNPKTKTDILEVSDIVIAMTTQRAENITDISEKINGGTVFKKVNSIMTIGNYDANSKYNIKNISRNLLKQKNFINTIPHNTILFEAMQEGQVIDIFIKFLGLKIKDENTFFIDEIKRLNESIEEKILAIRRMGM